ncbi:MULTISPECIES: TetR/AcrR family transcriptional regulator [unclassified Streptosporangium]|uniref:TetR/AcrR family transcriptional regulator n=1 Tax=unclassified Streptosporangium TaxID=2632669 RepID=UPI002E2DA09F|nr:MULTISPECIES: TetR/AcrR family transcriptional regulator [unclassified Streptosporangium]
MRSWSDDNPKAQLMQRKRTAIVDAAREAFLDTGYAETSVHRIAAAAGVSIKTVYRHFDGKDDLFSAVMQDACATPEGLRDEHADLPWFTEPPQVALPLAGVDYLRRVLSSTELALYRVVTRDTPRFPELGHRYRQVMEVRVRVLGQYLDHWAPSQGWKIGDPRSAAATFVAMLGRDLFEDALHGVREPTETEIIDRAHTAADQLMTLLRCGI